MPLQSLIVLLVFTLLGVIFFSRVMILSGSGVSLVGLPPIEKRYYYTGKGAVITTWGLFIVKAIFPFLGYIRTPDPLAWTAIVLLLAGSTLLTLSFLQLGTSLRMGIPIESTTLHRTGAYRFSRNPIYTGIHLVSAGSCFYFPDLLNITLALYGIWAHHRIILAEERFLADRFGTEWEEYAAMVKRYF